MTHSKVRETAEAQFKRTQKTTHLKGTELSETQQQRQAVFVKTARLKELRLAREALDPDGGLAHGDRVDSRMPKTST